MEINLLGIIGSPRTNSNSKIMINRAVKGFESIIKTETTTIMDISKLKIQHCIACNKCRELKKCIIKDDFNDIFEQWVKADALIYSVPVYHMSVPSKLKAIIDKIGHVYFSSCDKNLPRLNKVGGVLAQGTSRYGGQELTIQYLINHFLLLNCIPVSGDTPQSYLGAPGQSTNWEKGSISDDKQALKTAEILGKRIAEMTRVIKTGIERNKDSLPEEYFQIKPPKS